MTPSRWWRWPRLKICVRVMSTPVTRKSLVVDLKMSSSDSSDPAQATNWRKYDSSMSGRVRSDERQTAAASLVGPESLMYSRQIWRMDPTSVCCPAPPSSAAP